MSSFEERLNGASKRKSAREHDEKMQRKRADGESLVAENEEKRRVEALKKSPEHKKILGFVRGNDFMTAMRMYTEKCGNSWQVGTGRYENKVVRRVDFVDKLFGWQDEIKKVEILRDVEFSERFSFKEKLDEGGVYLPMDVQDESRPQNSDDKVNFSIKMPSAVNTRLFLFVPSFRDGEGYGHVYNGEEFQLFYNPEEIDKDVDYQYDDYDFSGFASTGKIYKSRGHIYLPQGIIVRGLFPVQDDTYPNLITNKYKNLTSDQFFDYIAEKIVSSGK